MNADAMNGPIAKIALHYGAGKNVVKEDSGLVTLRHGTGARARE
jgi:hypothetical protein